MATKRDGEEFNIKSTRESCKVCNKSILTHNRIIACHKCNVVYHAECSKNHFKFNHLTRQWQCFDCITNSVPRYNPFNDNNLLTVYQLHKYHCTLEMFKIVKLRLPISLYSLFNMSNRRENYFITPNPSTSFVYQSAFMWNSCYKLSSLYNIEFSTAIVTVKHKLKTVLLNAQKQFDKSIWFPNNHDLSGISF